MSFRFSNKSLDRMSGIDSTLYQIAQRAIGLSVIDFGIPGHGGLRTTEDQKGLFRDGKSQLDGEEKKSYHQTGMALDVYAYVDGKASWDECHLAMVACAMLQAASELGYRLEWGGLWKGFRDMPHFQLMRG